MDLKYQVGSVHDCVDTFACLDYNRSASVSACLEKGRCVLGKCRAKFF